MVNVCLFVGVEFGARMITIDGKQIKLQIWDTVTYLRPDTQGGGGGEGGVVRAVPRLATRGRWCSVKTSSDTQRSPPRPAFTWPVIL